MAADPNLPLKAPHSLDEIGNDPTDPMKQETARLFARRYASIERAREAWLDLVTICYRAKGSLETWEAAENEAIVRIAMLMGTSS